MIKVLESYYLLNVQLFLVQLPIESQPIFQPTVYLLMLDLTRVQLKTVFLKFAQAKIKPADDQCKIREFQYGYNIVGNI